MHNPLRILLPLLAMLATISACELLNPEQDESTTIDPDLGTGWGGSEDGAHIQDDVLFLGGGNLPAKVEWSPFLPPVGNQGLEGTCVAWATGYYQKTLLNALDGNWSSAQLSNPANQTSAKDLFFSIDLSQRGDDEHGECWGTYFESAYNQLQARGAANMALAPYVDLGNCTAGVDPSWTQNAASNRIESWRQMAVEVDAIKEKLVAKYPVGIATVLRSDFLNYKSGVLKTNNGPKDYPHAMLVVGYDDNLNAFKIVNSWGTAYQNQGFAWVDYQLFVTDFCRFAFVAYNSINPPDPDDDNNPPSAVGGDLRAWVYSDLQDSGNGGPRQRSLVFDVFNMGAQTLPSTPAWDAVYLYFNAYDMNDYGVILHQRVTGEFGQGMGAYPQGSGSSGNFWSNAWVAPGGSLGQAMFNTPSVSIRWDYTMPYLNGDYYLVLVADPFNAVAEPNEQDNYYYLTNPFGGPIRFLNGAWQGFTNDKTDDRSLANSPAHSPVREHNLNAYTPKELSFFLRKMKRNGRLQQMVKNMEQETPRPEH